MSATSVCLALRARLAEGTPHSCQCWILSGMLISRRPRQFHRCVQAGRPALHDRHQRRRRGCVAAAVFRVFPTRLSKPARRWLTRLSLPSCLIVQRLKPPKKLLKSQQILAQRSQHPAVFSKPSSSAPPSKKHLTQEQKDRLRRIARKDVKGPFNAIIANDPTKWGDGSALFNGHEGGKEYDAWVAAGGAETQGEWDGPRTFIQKKVKTPKTLATMIRPEVPAVREPATGQSYNPTQEAHQALLQQAYDVEVARIAEEQRSRVIKDKMAAARKDEQERDGPSKELVYGMQVDLPKEGEDSDAEEGADREEGEAEGAEWKKSLKRPERKTRQQRLKAQKGAAKVRLLYHSLVQDCAWAFADHLLLRLLPRQPSRRLLLSRNGSTRRSTRSRRFASRSTGR